MPIAIMQPVNCLKGGGISCEMIEQFVPARRSTVSMPELTCERCTTQPGEKVILPIEQTIWSGRMVSEVMADLCPHQCAYNRINRPKTS